VGLATAGAIIGRIERLPSTFWHVKVRAIVGTATFFDGFDAVAIAFVLPALIGLWHLQPSEIGLLLSSGFAGQLIGAPLFGWLAERYGRIRVLNWTILILSVFGLACAFAWSYWSLAAFRFIQGFGLGGEIPVAATFVSEISKAERRGRFVCSTSCCRSDHGGLAQQHRHRSQSRLAMDVHRRRGSGVPDDLPAPPAPESPRWLARHGRQGRPDHDRHRDDRGAQASPVAAGNETVDLQSGRL
jgi:putative MFS transporter